jgi:hypothetical protein
MVGTFVFKPMAKQRYVNTKFWDDKYIRSLDPSGKLLFIYLFTNSLATIAGAYEIELDRMKFDTGISSHKIATLLEKFAADNKAHYQDGWLLMVNTVSHQTTVNAKIKKGVEETVKCCPDWIKYRLSIAYHWLSHLNPNLNTNSNSNNGRIADPKKPNAPKIEVDIWLDAIAKQVGAADRDTLADSRKWADVVEGCLKEHRNLPDLLAVIHSELIRLKDTPQFFTPANIFKQLQLGTATNGKAEKLPSIDEIDARRKANMTLKPVPKTA